MAALSYPILLTAMQSFPPPLNRDKLNKVLALADSAHEGEALAALRAARAMLRGSGVELGDVLGKMADQAPSGRAGLSRVAPPDVVASLQREIIQQQQKNNQLQAMLREQQRETAHWRRLAEEKGKSLSQSLQEKEHWHKLAEQTTHKLWDILRELEEEGKKKLEMRLGK